MKSDYRQSWGRFYVKKRKTLIEIPRSFMDGSFNSIRRLFENYFYKNANLIIFPNDWLRNTTIHIKVFCTSKLLYFYYKTTFKNIIYSQKWKSTNLVIICKNLIVPFFLYNCCTYLFHLCNTQFRTGKMFVKKY